MIGRKNSQSSRREIGSFPVRRVQGAAIDWLEDEGRWRRKRSRGRKKITTKQEKSVEKRLMTKHKEKKINRDEMHHRKKLYFWVELHLKI